MFTGIISSIGAVVAVKKDPTKSEICLEVATPYFDTTLGESISINGVCLTINYIYKHNNKCILSFFVSSETLHCTNLSDIIVGSHVNLERALRLQDRLSGHLVQGHVDGVAIIQAIKQTGNSVDLKLEAPKAVQSFLIEKGSVTLDGVSLTINKIENPCFWVRVIPHTWDNTTFHKKQMSNRLNLELDVIAKYVKQLL